MNHANPSGWRKRREQRARRLSRRPSDEVRAIRAAHREGEKLPQPVFASSKPASEMSRAELILHAEQHGIAIDKRLGTDKLRERINADSSATEKSEA